MLNPINIVMKYFKAAAGAPDATVIAAPTVLAGILPVMVTALGTLKVVPLTGGERQGLKGKDPVNQRQVSRGLLRFATRRPDLAQKAQIDLDAYSGVIQKDEAYDILYNVLGQLVQIVDDGLLLLRAAMSQSTATVATYVQEALHSGDLDATTTTQIQVYFGAVDLGAAQQADKAAGKRQRHLGKLKAGQKVLAHARGTMKDQPAVDRLIADAKAGVDASKNLLPAATKGLKGGVK